jgi:hypothetical protein
MFCNVRGRPNVRSKLKISTILTIIVLEKYVILLYNLSCNIFTANKTFAIVLRVFFVVSQSFQLVAIKSFSVVDPDIDFGRLDLDRSRWAKITNKKLK